MGNHPNNVHLFPSQVLMHGVHTLVWCQGLGIPLLPGWPGRCVDLGIAGTIRLLAIRRQSKRL